VREAYLGISILNGPRQGFQYRDTAGVEYAYRLITTEIINDTTLPVNVDVAFKGVYDHPCFDSGPKFRLFLLPRELTPEHQRFDTEVSPELKHFLDAGPNTGIELHQKIQPGESVAMSIVALTEKKYIDPFQLAVMTKNHLHQFNGHHSLIQKKVFESEVNTLSLGLDFFDLFGKDTAKCYLVVPCGKITFMPG
jgi:hypothetical protein